MRISVLGCGYLGVTHAACMTELGFDVLGVEIDQRKLKQLQDGEVPFYEPGLGDLLRRGMESGRLSFTSELSEAAAFADVHFICVGTPQLPDSSGADLTFVDAVIEGIAPHLDRPSLLVGKSTVPVGTAKRLAERVRTLAPAGASAGLAWNPEFLREGHAVQDTLAPDRLVFGVSEQSHEAQLRAVYSEAIARNTPVIIADLPTAELVKVSANAFLATKISFINAISEVCDASGADVVKLAEALGHDDRIGKRFLHAGIGFGGGCLPKDIRAFQHRAGELGVDDALGFLREVDSINLRRRDLAVRTAKTLLGDVRGARIAVLGAAFKPESDDVRDSPALWIADQLQLAGAAVRLYDPRAMSNAHRLYPTLDYAPDVFKACQDTDLVLHLTEWQEFRDLDPAVLKRYVARPQILDGRNCLDPAAWRAAGWHFTGMGRP